ncbi:hypothetical protein ACTWP5_17690 [Streptomyces sp. 4N509B]|uniref:hypothetical protein n=1 Tax=Streptomyces sp. 4N509B TaxID=3457413 RepID=UPI003FD387CD
MGRHPLVRAAVVTAGTTAGTAAGAAAARALVAWRRHTRGTEDGRHRWLVVTVYRPPEEIAPGGELPEPLGRMDRELDQGIEVEVREAPGGRGGELAVRPRRAPERPDADGGHAGARDDTRAELRGALRDAKALLEAGEVIEPDRPPTTRPTLRGRLVGAATRRASREGVL